MLDSTQTTKEVSDPEAEWPYLDLADTLSIVAVQLRQNADTLSIAAIQLRQNA